jgi:hypothetical protein
MRAGRNSKPLIINRKTDQKIEIEVNKRKNVETNNTNQYSREENIKKEINFVITISNEVKRHNGLIKFMKKKKECYNMKAEAIKDIEVEKDINFQKEDK